jgi:hypothetical protein
MRSEMAPAATEPWRHLIADMVLWLALVLLFLAFRITLFSIFHAELPQQPSGRALMRCFETGLRSDTCAATWGLLPSFALTSRLVEQIMTECVIRETGRCRQIDKSR